MGLETAVGELSPGGEGLGVDGVKKNGLFGEGDE